MVILTLIKCKQDFVLQPLLVWYSLDSQGWLQTHSNHPPASASQIPGLQECVKRRGINGDIYKGSRAILSK